MLTLGLHGPVAVGQPAFPISGPTTTDAVRQRAAIEATRAVTLDLRMRADVLIEDYSAAASALSLIRELAPEDTALLRRGISAAFSGGDTALMESLTRELVRLDPEDTVAQLRLISQIIGRAQTVEDRLAAYGRFLGPAGSRLDPSVRSRLALDAALLQRELGDSDRFVELLSQATSLDATNKSAASLAAQFFAARIDDPMGRLELQVNLLYADPVDPNVHAAISRELLAEGAFTQARRFFQNSALVARILGRDDEGLVVKQLELEFLIDDPASVADALQGRLTGLRIEAQRKLDFLVSKDLPTTGEPNPDEVRLPRNLEFLRLLSADAAGRETQRRAAMDGLTQTITEEIELLYDAGAKAADEAARAGYIRDLVSRFVQLQIVRLMMDLDTEQVEEGLQALAGRLDGTGPIRASLAPWIALSSGDAQGAMDQIQAERPTALNNLCAGIASRRLGNTDEAVRRLLRSANSLTNPALSAWARRLAVQTGGLDAVITPTGREMAAFVDRVPDWIDRMTSNPSSFMLMSVEPTSAGVASGEEAMLRVRIENIAPMPLGLGADRTISSRLLISPSLDRAVTGFVGTGQPEVLELDHRLRLRPGEGVEVVIPADLGYTGWLIGSNAHVTMRERWRVLQDFWIGGSGAIESGAVALTANTDSVRRWVSLLSRLTWPELTTRVEEASGDDLAELGAVIRTMLMHPGFEDQRAAVGLDELVSALIGRYARGGVAERVLMLSMLPHAHQAGVMRAFDDAVIELAADGSVGGVELAMVLLTRVTDPAAPVLAAAAASEDHAMASLARVLRSRLTDGRATLATVGPGFEELAGMTPSRFVGEDGP
ncbi:MAG: hypothetical protein ACI89L_000367 [Phycisphaerales bacterium]|jgi:hypothetical protein